MTNSNLIISKIRQSNQIIEQIKRIPKIKEEYEISIFKLELILEKINNKLHQVKGSSEKLKKKTGSNILEDTNNSFKLKRLEDEKNTLENHKRDVLHSLNEVKKENNDLIFNIDDVIISNLDKFEQVSNNFKLLFEKKWFFNFKNKWILLTKNGI